MEASASADGILIGDDGNELPALVESPDRLINLYLHKLPNHDLKCIKMERELEVILRRTRGTHDVNRIPIESDKIINCVSQMSNVKCRGFPAAAIALKVSGDGMQDAYVGSNQEEMSQEPQRNMLPR
ncbi:hypothetical protein ACP4OV_001106 [Aristida adscensionis]